MNTTVLAASLVFAGWWLDWVLETLEPRKKRGLDFAVCALYLLGIAAASTPLWWR